VCAGEVCAWPEFLFENNGSAKSVGNCVQFPQNNFNFSILLESPVARAYTSIYIYIYIYVCMCVYVCIHAHINTYARFDDATILRIAMPYDRDGRNPRLKVA